MTASTTRLITNSTENTTTAEVTRLVFDLTVETEHCAICSNVLGQGNDHKSRIFALGTCGCVCPPWRYSWRHANLYKVMCGDCVLGCYPEAIRVECFSAVEIWCSRHDHFTHGRQIASELFGLECTICQVTVAEKYDDSTCREGLQGQTDRVRTRCGEYSPKSTMIGLLIS
jgi:hypothetical protein